MGDLLDKLEKENKQHVKQLKLDYNESVVNEIISGLLETSNMPQGSDYEDYCNCLKLIQKEYDARAITEFSMKLGDYEKFEWFNTNIGLYLSALVNNYCHDHPQDTVNIYLHTLTKPPLVVGYRNCGNLIIHGDVGHSLGYRMYKGSIIVNGNADFGVGSYLFSGEIVINGSVNGYLGDLMKNGKITVNGNAGYDVGWGMENGIIEINGDIGSLGDYTRGMGTIYHKNKLILKHGKRIY